MDVGTWLRDLGLGQYEQAFRENDIDGDVLADLTADDLSGLGVVSIGHRRKLLAAIAALRAGLPPAMSPPTQPQSTISRTVVLPSCEAERRQLTVMFVDLVGSTALAARLDPEDMREVIGTYHRRIAETVGRLGGFVAKYMGDGVLVYFGWPQADEADAERAVRAALTTLDVIGQIAPKGERLAARIGIASGLAVVGDLLGVGAAQEQTVIGETPNLAARLQSLADPGCAVVDAETRRRIGGLFECRDLGAVHLKGVPGPVCGWQVLGEAVVQSRFEAMHTAALTPLVGREDELELLLRRWRQAKEGEGQVVLISGEPGIGKSRLIAALEERVTGEPISSSSTSVRHTTVRALSSPSSRAGGTRSASSTGSLRTGGSTSWKLCYAPSAPPRTSWRSSPRCSAYRVGNAIRHWLSARSRKRSGPSEHCCDSSKNGPAGPPC
jgi:class 3 adenylate cyclase